MGAAVIGALRVVLGADTAQFTDGMKRAQSQLATAGKRFQSVGAGMAKVGAGLSVAVTAPLIAFGFAAVKAGQESAEALGQVTAVLKSMGPAAGRSAEQLQALAKTLQFTSTFDDDDILRSVTANLLTFGTVSGQVFDRAQQAIVDYSSRTGKDLQASTLMIGRALNDPIKGMGALQKAGVKLTDTQKAQIATFIKTGQAAKAQGIVLDALATKFGGSAAAMRASDPWSSIRNSLDDFKETVGPIIAKVLPPLLDFAAKLFDRFSKLSPAMQQFVVIGAGLAAALGPVMIALGGLVSLFGVLLPLLAPIAVPLLAIGAAVAVAVGAFLLFRKQVMPALQEFGKTVADVLGPKVQPLIKAATDLFTAFGAIIAKNFGPGTVNGTALRIFAEGVKRGFSAMVQVVGGAIDVITNIMRALSALLRGDFSAMWGHLGNAAKAVGVTLINVFKALFPEVVQWVSKTYTAVKQWLVDKFEAVVQAVKAKVDAVVGFFKGMWEAVVGHSYVPDMVTEIGLWMARLDSMMIAPAKGATDAVKSHFEALRDDVKAILESLLTDTERSTMEMERAAERMREALRTGAIDPSTYNAYLHRREAMKPITLSQGPSIDAGGLSTDGPAEAQKTWQAIQNGIRESREAMRATFSTAFSEGIRAALNGDLKGWLQGVFNSIFDASMKRLGEALFNLLGGQGGGGGGWLNTLLNVGMAAMGGTGFGNKGAGFTMKNVPGFAGGGGFTVGGTGGMDSQLRTMRLTPGERVSISKGDQGGGAVRVHVVPSPYFDVRVEQISRTGDRQVEVRMERKLPSLAKAAVSDGFARGQV